MCPIWTWPYSASQLWGWRRGHGHNLSPLYLHPLPTHLPPGMGMLSRDPVSVLSRHSPVGCVTQPQPHTWGWRSP